MRRSDKGFVSILELLVVLVVVCFLFYFMFNMNAGKQGNLDEDTRESLSKSGIDTSTPITIMKSTRKKVEDLNKQTLEKDKATEELFKK